MIRPLTCFVRSGSLRMLAFAPRKRHVSDIRTAPDPELRHRIRNLRKWVFAGQSSHNQVIGRMNLEDYLDELERRDYVRAASAGGRRP